MKKLVSLLAAGALALGLVGCAGNLHDVSLIDLTGFGLRGTLTGWNAADDVALVANEDGSYSYTFTSTDDTTQFAVLQMGDGTWDTAYRLAQPKAEGDKANVFDETNGMTQKVYRGQSADCMSVPGTKGKSVTIKVVPNTTYLDVTVTISGDAPASTPTPFYLDGEYVVGCGGASMVFDFAKSNLLWNPQLKKTTGDLIYTYDFVATTDACGWHTDDAVFKLANCNWAGSYGKKDIEDLKVTVGAPDYVELEAGGDNTPISGLKAGSAYRLEIKTDVDGKVYAKIYEIAKITLSFKVINLEEGQKAWVNGSFWGSDWPQKWPIVAWNSNDETATAEAIAAHGPAVVDADGNAIFEATWNKELIAEIGQDFTWACKVVYIDGDTTWDTEGAVKDSGSKDLSCEYKVTGSGNFTVVIDADDWGVSVK